MKIVRILIEYENGKRKWIYPDDINWVSYDSKGLLEMKTLVENPFIKDSRECYINIDNGNDIL